MGSSYEFSNASGPHFKDGPIMGEGFGMQIISRSRRSTLGISAPFEAKSMKCPILKLDFCYDVRRWDPSKGRVIVLLTGIVSWR